MALRAFIKAVAYREILFQMKEWLKEGRKLILLEVSTLDIPIQINQSILVIRVSTTHTYGLQ